MIDHVLGRPSSRFRKVQVLLAVSFWSLYLLLGNPHGPLPLRRLSTWLYQRHLTPWRTMVLTLTYLYVARNFAKIVGLESPEPLANLYNRSYFRATWITTALDAGFWSAMKIRRKWMRDICSIIFTVYYLIAAEQADEKVRKVRAVMTVDHMRVSWNKSTTPYLSFFTGLLRPKFTKYGPRRITIARPKHSSYTEPVQGWMYYNGTLKELEQETKLVLDIPGGGFVAMSPRESDDKLLCWAGRIGIPILSLDYRKAPEYPFPYALNECFDVYKQIIISRGACVGMKSGSLPRVVLTGDSAGGNLATGTTLMIIEHNISHAASGRSMIPSPAGLVLLYPALDMNIGSWMSEDQMALIRKPGTRAKKEYAGFIKRKSEDIDRRYTATTPRPAEDSDEDKGVNGDYFSARPTSASPEPRSNTPPKKKKDIDIEAQRQKSQEHKPQQLRTRLAVSSIISYYNDRILTPEMMRAMVILYVGPHQLPSFRTDHLLCPAVAPETLLTKFPKTYFLTGERDPLVDDTVFFAGRLREAKRKNFEERKELGLEKSSANFDERAHVEVSLIPGISHGFVQFVSIFPEGWKHVHRCAGWISDIFNKPPHNFEGPSIEAELRRSSLQGLHHAAGSGSDFATPTTRHHRLDATAGTSGESEGDDDAPLAMTSTNGAADKRRTHKKNKRRRDRSTSRSPSPSSGKDIDLSSLPSEEDLLKRRMQGLTFSLMGSEA
ncbi:hypothetical protein LTR05_003210 [Lithohypha guttulata]|uniref:Alpha/beta hydrolase fold-3 domain-containing protein n=1 Tax=Lithohypha guttulata TaxID=1690604 RepID=A0AAN7T3X5_9EURO|nr:hypothetical protein LTR05_003210 [Lithohypha guttulata]